jgi:methylmalonyl-CoA mutase
MGSILATINMYHMTSSLFSEFSPSEYSDWVNQVTKELKGKTTDSLISFTRDGISIQPMYTKDFPGRVVQEQPVKNTSGWTITEEIAVDNEEEDNQVILDKIYRGANGLVLYVYDNVQLDVLLKNVQLQFIQLNFVVEGDGKTIIQKLVEVAKNQGLHPDQLKGSVNVDPIEAAARTGEWKENAKKDLSELKILTDDAPSGIKTFCVNNNLFANAGATPAQQLGISLAHLHEYLLLTDNHQNNRFWLNMAIGNNYFEEIAKFRAVRRLWKYLLQQYKTTGSPLYLFAETGLRNKTIYDPWVNMLRSATEAMSAAMGGCDEILVRSYDSAFREPNVIGSRVARNQQLIMAYESYFDKVQDPAAGSYFVENLTEELAEKGWAFFKEIEKEGGMIAALEKGWIQDKIETAAADEQEMFDQGKIVLLGTNLYPNKAELMKNQLEDPAFNENIASETSIRRLAARRLAEQYEKARLQAE